MFFFSSRRRHTRYWRDWSSDVCSSDLWQEVQALPWSTEIVALTCGIQDCLRPPSSLLKRPRQACCATPAQDQKCWNAAAFEQSQFFDHTPSIEPGIWISVKTKS